jgi:hypothetical protein
MTKQVQPSRGYVNHTVEIRAQGIKVKRSGLPPIPNAPKGRQAIKELSRASGGRLRDNLEAVDPAHGFPYFITLTYPQDFPGDWETWKRHLHNFRRSLWDIRGQEWIGAIWRLEAQRRGAPHYHILLWGKNPFRTIKDFRQWTAEAWYRVVGSGDAKHLAAGIQIKAIKSQDDYFKRMGYICKYLGKDSVHPSSQVFKDPVGRYWGVWHKSKLHAPIDQVMVPGRVYDKIRRTLRKKREARHRNKPTKILKGKEAFNHRQARQMLRPGTRDFMTSEVSWKLLSFYDPPPF